MGSQFKNKLKSFEKCNFSGLDFYLYGVIAIHLNRFKSQRALLLETDN